MRKVFWPFSRFAAAAAQARALVDADALALIARYGDSAYGEARARANDTKTIDAARPPQHWHKVRSRVAHHTGKITGADKYFRD